MAKESTKKTVKKVGTKDKMKKVKKLSTIKEEVKEIKEELTEKKTELKSTQKTNLNNVIRLLGVIIVGVGLFLAAKKYRGVFVAGMVNTHPITKMELVSRMEERYGQAAFDEIVSEYLLMDAAKKNGILVTANEIDAEIATNEAQLGGKDALRQMAKTAGITTEDQLRKFFNLKLTVTKLQEKLFPETVTDEEIKKYFDENKEVYAKKKYEEVKDSIRTELAQQKVAEKFSSWFTKLRTDAKIFNYLTK